MLSLAKIPLIFTTALFYDRSFTAPPSPPVVEEEQKKALKAPDISLTERLIPPAGFLLKTTYWTMSAAEIASVLAIQYPSHNLAQHIRTLLTLDSPETNLSSIGTITPTYLLGSALIITGTLIRFRCFREMGRHFTFRLTLRENHKLVTSGPYSIVRHPSYTAGMMTVVGSVLTLVGGGSWWRGVGGWNGAGLLPKICAGVLGVTAAFCVRVYARAAKEDRYLKQEFSDEWEEWAKRVPCKYLPGIY